MEWPTGIYVAIVATLANGFFAGIETGLTSAREVVLLHRAEVGGWWSRLAANLMRRREQAIVGAVVGNNVAVVFGSAAATAACVYRFGSVGETYAAIAMSAVTVLVGEALPKAAYRARPERLIWATAPFYRVLEILMTPAVFLAIQLSNIVLKMLRIRPASAGSQLSRDALRILIDQSLGERDRQHTQNRMLRRSLEHLTTPTLQRVTPLEATVCLRADSSVRDAIALIEESGHSRLPVRDGRGLRGLVLFSDLLDAEDDEPILDFEREIAQLDANLGLDEALVMLAPRGTSLAAVVDEGGNTLGIVTLEDLLEPLVGDILDEHDAAAG